VKCFHYMNIQNDNDEWKNERTTRNVSMLKVEICVMKINSHKNKLVQIGFKK